MPITDWNVLVTVRDGAQARAYHLLKELGRAAKTPDPRVMVVRAKEVAGFVEDLAGWLATDPPLEEAFERVLPLTVTFELESGEELEAKALAASGPYLSRLEGRSLAVRVYPPTNEHTATRAEQLGADMAAAAAALHTPTTLDGSDPDVFIVVGAWNGRGGLSMWTREERQRYPFLHLP